MDSTSSSQPKGPIPSRPTRQAYPTGLWKDSSSEANTPTSSQFRRPTETKGTSCERTRNVLQAWCQRQKRPLPSPLLAKRDLPPLSRTPPATAAPQALGILSESAEEKLSEEAVLTAYEKALKEDITYIPVYEADGVTQVGVYPIG